MKAEKFSLASQVKIYDEFVYLIQIFAYTKPLSPKNVLTRKKFHGFQLRNPRISFFKVREMSDLRFAIIAVNFTLEKTSSLN